MTSRENIISQTICIPSAEIVIYMYDRQLATSKYEIRQYCCRRTSKIKRKLTAAPTSATFSTYLFLFRWFPCMLITQLHIYIFSHATSAPTAVRLPMLLALLLAWNCKVQWLLNAGVGSLRPSTKSIHAPY